MNYHDDLDRRLCHIENQFDFLYYITPSNHTQSWQAFKANGFRAAPQIQYRPKPNLLPLKEELEKLAQESHSTSALHQIYRAKIHETGQMIALVEAMGQPEFRNLSIQLFGQPDTELLHVAKHILKNVDAKTNHQQNVDALQLKDVFDQQITEYQTRHPTFTPEVIVRDDIDSMLVSRTKLYVGAGFKTSMQRAHALCAHEVGTHLVTHFNGLRQPVKLFAYGLAAYDELQEGIAVLSEHLVGGLSQHRMRILAGRIVAVEAMLQDMPFMDIFALLHHDHQFAAQDAYELCSRVFRGGAFTKDTIYLRGILRVKEMLQQGQALSPLFLGKISFTEIKDLQAFKDTGLICDPKIHPHFIKEEGEEARRLEALASKSIEELID